MAFLFKHYSKYDLEWCEDTFHITEEEAKKLLDTERGYIQNKSLVTRMTNTRYVNQHPHNNYAREMSQISGVRFDASVDASIKVSELGFTWQNYDIFFSSSVPRDQKKKVKDDLRKLERKGEDMLKVSECKLQARRKKKSVTLPKVMMVVLWSMNSKGHCEGTFFTGTFSPRYMRETTRKERRKAIRQWAASQGSDYYVINIDYGKRNGREHYHILFSGHVDVETYRHEFHSLCYVEEIYGDFDHLAYYVTKLTNHAVKESTKDKSNSSMMSSKTLSGVTSAKHVRMPLESKSKSLDPNDSHSIISLNDGHSHYANGTINDDYEHNYDKDTLDLVRGKVHPMGNRLRGCPEDAKYRELAERQAKYNS